jgi:hypothetical protein
MILRVPDDAVLLRAARMERDDFGTRRIADSCLVCKTVLEETISLSSGRSLSKKAQFESLPSVNATLAA